MADILDFNTICDNNLCKHTKLEKFDWNGGKTDVRSYTCDKTRVNVGVFALVEQRTLKKAKRKTIKGAAAFVYVLKCAHNREIEKTGIDKVLSLRPKMNCWSQTCLT